MFDFIRKLFGEGTIRFEMVTRDGRKGVGKVPYMGNISTIDSEEFEMEMIDKCYVKYGERVVGVKITGYCR